MNLFAFPIEIRLKIYSELLVSKEAIILSASPWGDFDARLCRDGVNLCPTLLSASKQLYSEAISCLYSDNCFRFSGVDPSSTITSFVQRIGAHTSLIRHVGVGFPTTPLADDSRYDYGLQNKRLDDLNVMKDACPGIVTLELLLSSEHAEFVLHSSAFAELLDLIHARLEAFRSLQEVKVDVEVINDGPYDESNNEVEDGENDAGEGASDHDWMSYREPLGHLRRRGWSVNIIKVPPKRETWTSPDDMIEFDNEDDYNDYMIVWQRREQQQEEEAWSDYYHQRRVEAYRMGYADDGGPA